MFVHRPAATPTSAIVTTGGAMGGVLGPGHARFQRLVVTWAARSVGVDCVGSRISSGLDRCAHDVAGAVEMAVEDGAERIVVMGHSFGGPRRSGSRS